MKRICICILLMCGYLNASTMYSKAVGEKLYRTVPNQRGAVGFLDFYWLCYGDTHSFTNTEPYCGLLLTLGWDTLLMSGDEVQT